jgi:hypothetical protein
MDRLFSSGLRKRWKTVVKAIGLGMLAMLLVLVVCILIVKSRYPGFYIASFTPTISGGCDDDVCGVGADPGIVPTFGDNAANAEVQSWVFDHFGNLRVLGAGNIELFAYLYTDGMTCGGINLWGPGMALRVSKPSRAQRSIFRDFILRWEIIPYCHSW